MSTQKIPNSQKQIIQSNDGEYKGNLYSTFNIDLDSNPGVIKTSRKLTRAVDSSINVWSAGSRIMALQIHDGFYYAITDDDAIRCSVSNDPTVQANWSAVPSAWSSISVFSDTTSFKGLLLTSTATNIGSYDGATRDDDWWTTVAGGTALTTGKPHTLEVLRTGNDTLFITDGNVIRYMNVLAGPTYNKTSITLDTLMTANTLTPSLDRMWVGTYTEVENHAYIYEIRVGDASALQAYEVEGRVCLSMFTYHNIPYVITERGYIQAFNGAGFQTVAQFPWANESKVMEGCRPGLVQDSPTAMAIHPKGVKVRGKHAYIFVNTDDEYVTNDAKLDTLSPSGVWVLDLETYSLTHRYALADSATNYGKHYVERSGPLLITNTPETRIMVGSSVDGEEGIWMESDDLAQGYFTTVRHESDSIADAFETFVVKADTLDTDESIIVKYKDVSRPNLPLTVTDISWLNANQFTTTNALTNVEVGDEVEIISGTHSGDHCNILSIEGSTTKTVTVDTDFGVLNALSNVQIDAFKKIETDMTESDGEYKKLGSSDGVSPSRQYKVWMKGDTIVREVISKSNAKETL
jgi:transcription antitermination factor NusG